MLSIGFSYKDCQANEEEDLCILTHSNRICIITLAETHPVLKGQKTIQKISFSVDGVNRLTNKVSGKGKRGAQELTAKSPLCKITCTDGEEFTVYAGFTCQLIEVNENLLHNPGLVTSKPQSDGYIAIVLPKKEHDKTKFKSQEEYKERRFCKSSNS